MIIVTGPTTAALANVQTQTVAFSAAVTVAPSMILYGFLVPAGGVAAIIQGDIVVGTITTTGFDITLTGLPGDALHKICFIAFS